LNAWIQEEMNFLGKVIGEDIEVRVHVAPDIRVTCADPTQIEQVLMNLCLNSRDAMPSGGKLVIETQNVELGDEFCRKHLQAQPGSYVLLSVSDTGVGMDEATQERIFEPFFTTKGPSKGTGLGLATVYGIVKQHGGFLNVYSEPGKGTSFRIYFKAEAGIHETAAATNIDGPRRGTETILVADDHEGLRGSAAEMLDALGYRTIVARDGAEALKLFEANHEGIDLVLMDIVMPKVSGPDAYAKMAEIRPGLKAIFTTGYSMGAVEMMSSLKARTGILQKPYGLMGLSQKIRSALDGERAE
jgi:CheY-like chemotaxis protein